MIFISPYFLDEQKGCLMVQAELQGGPCSVLSLTDNGQSDRRDEPHDRQDDRVRRQPTSERWVGHGSLLSVGRGHRALQFDRRAMRRRG